VKIVLNGLTGPVTVNGKIFNSVMPPMSQLNDDELANILTYVTHTWGNDGLRYSAQELTETRKATARPPGAAD
jgi:nitrite reductase (NO-forming)